MFLVILILVILILLLLLLLLLPLLLLLLLLLKLINFEDTIDDNKFNSWFLFASNFFIALFH